MRTVTLVLAAALVAACAEDTREFVPRTVPDGRPPRLQADVAPVASIGWTGCDISKKAYMTEAARAYAEKTGVEIIVTGGGATRGIRATAGGRADIGGTCRHCLPEVADQEKGAVMTHVAWDALVFFTHKDNPVDSITLDEAKAVLTGRISNWNELRGPDAKILRAFRQQTVEGKLSGVGYMTRLLLFGDAQVDYTQDAIFHRSSKPIELFVQRTPFSLAVTGVSSARKRDVKILALDRVNPRDKKNIASGRYPLFRPLYLVTKGEPEGRVRDFIEWIVGPEGQAELERQGTVTLEEGRKLRDLYKHWPEDKSLIRNY
jgi:phosphate transport system substrate-binding protein